VRRFDDALAASPMSAAFHTGHTPLCTLSERSPFSRSVSFRSLGWLLEARLANESKRAGKSEDH
jgi:hypothetical protein